MSSAQLDHLELEIGWLSTAASQIFFMQLGFLCFEVGYVDKMWAKSIIIKNIEDTFIGALTYIMIGYTLTTGATYFGIIGKPDNILLIGVDKSLHASVFLNTCYATTCVTIISGAVLERMKNSAYITYAFLVLLINYSFANCWMWNNEGFLHKLGIVDCGGAFVVHVVGGMAGFIAVYNLGPRKGSLVSEQVQDGEYPASESDQDTKYKLMPAHPAKQPALMVIGAFILWYGWFAFNITSPLVAHLDIGANLAECGLNVLLAPCCSAVTCLIYSRAKSKSSHEMVNFEDLVSCILAGLVTVTACCYTVPYWAACVVGIAAVPMYFVTAYYVREKLYVDDPLCVTSVHLMPGLLGIFLEGVFANGSVEGSDAGLVYGGFKHFGLQTFAIIIGVMSQLLICVFLWNVVLKTLYKNESVAINTLDTYLGLGYFDPVTALEEMLLCRDATEKKMLLSFKQLCDEYARTYQLDFLVCVTRLKKKFNRKNLKEIYQLYCKNNAMKNVHITQNAQDVILNNMERAVGSCKFNIKSYDVAYRSVFEGLRGFVKEFLQNYAKHKYQRIDMTVKLKEKYLPFKVDSCWNVAWMTDPPLPAKVTPIQKRRIEQMRVYTSNHIAKLSHDSYSVNSDHAYDGLAESLHNVHINMAPLEQIKERNNQKLNPSTIINMEPGENQKSDHSDDDQSKPNAENAENAQLETLNSTRL